MTIGGGPSAWGIPVRIARLACGAAITLPSASPFFNHGPTVGIIAAGAVTGAALPLHFGARVMRTAGGYVRQWPGTYFEGAFEGYGALIRVGTGDVVLHVQVDTRPAVSLPKPQPGLYRIGGLSSGRHRIRVDIASESEISPTVFGGLYAVPGTRPRPVTERQRQIEFIGDSHTVGYGNLSTSRLCTDAQVWATTATSRGDRRADGAPLHRGLPGKRDFRAGHRPEL